MKTRVIVENNRDNFIHPTNLKIAKSIDRVEMHPPLLHMFNTEVNNMNIVVKLLVIYCQDPHIMLQILQNQHKNIIV